MPAVAFAKAGPGYPRLDQNKNGGRKLAIFVYSMLISD
jgi:hypothetical protein